MVLLSAKTALQKCGAAENFALVDNKFFVTAPYVNIQSHDKMDDVNTSEWLRSAGTMNELWCIAIKGSFEMRELAYNEVQSSMDCTALLEVAKNGK